MEKAYIRKTSTGRYQFGIRSVLRKNEISWSISSWKNKRTAINKIKSSKFVIVDLTKE